MRGLWIGLALCLAAGCSIPVRQARTSMVDAERLPEEQAAYDRFVDQRCPTELGLLLAGLAAYCGGRDDAAGLLLVGSTELAAGITTLVLAPPQREVDLFGKGGRYVALFAYTDLWLYDNVQSQLDEARMARTPYVPLDTTAELIASPFNVQVMKRPPVLLGTLAMAGGAVALTAAMAPAPTPSFGAPNLFGAHPPPAVGYPLGAALHGGLMIQVAIVEEAVFRGQLQSSLVRSLGSQTGGWALGSVLFGGVHALNLPFIPADERASYALIALPYITLAGSWMGLVYRWGGYSLAPPVAVHFWYNTLVSGAAFLVDPETHPFAMQVGGRF